MKKLYVVQIENEVVVVADSAAEAELLAKQAPDYELGDSDFQAYPMTHMPWDGDQIPIGDRDESDPDRTIAGWIEAGAAPEYKAKQDGMMAKLAAKGDKGDKD